MRREGILLSIRPRYARGILDGTKTVELRRRAPQLRRGDLVLVYETSPTKAIVGSASVASISTDSPAALWARVRATAGVTRREFDEYFAGTTVATAIRLSDVHAFDVPIELSTMRRRWPWLTPPQSFRYVEAVGVNGAIGKLAPRG